MMKTTLLAANAAAILRIGSFVAAAMLLGLLTSQTILISPSHPDDIDDPDEAAKHYGVTFPIPELGNCGSYTECRTYCEDPVNADACISYAKGKGFYQDEPDEKVRDVLARAKTELGCDSYESCQNFCEITTNYQRCNSFAQNQDLIGGYIHNPGESRILEQAKTVLGCNSPSSCQTFCEQEASRDKCSEFAKTVGLRGGEHPVGPGGCTSEQTCKTFCSDPNNYQICSGFSSSTGGQFSGPGGCTSEASCRAYCEQYPQECGYGGEAGPPPGYNPQEMCNRTPGCAWGNNTCQCETGGITGDQPGSYDPASECTKYGCSWTGTSCQCTQQISPTPYSGSGGSYTPYPTSGAYSSPSTYDPATECTKTAGCSWTGSSCQCSSNGGSSGESYSPYPESGSYPSPSPSVQASTTQRGWLEIIGDFLSRLLGR